VRAQPTPPHAIALSLVATTEDMAAAFRARFAPWKGVEVVHGRWEELPPHDCFVTAGNAYGLMSAGIDAAVIATLGPRIEEEVQFRILDDYLGEQPIGTAFLLETHDAHVAYLCHAPTMRVPTSIQGTDNVYRAARAAMLCVYHHNLRAERVIRSLVFPAFGAGFGAVPPDEVARQMSVAWRLFLELPFRPDWDRVTRRERLICWDDGERRIR
jgi:O-acetyl-ADP-ribose deacetylase (regulator of RNase III)